MALAFDVASTKAQSFSATASWSHTCSGSNRILFVSAACNSGATPVAATYNGVSMVAVKSQNTGGQGFNGSHTVFALINPASGVNTVVVTPSATSDIAAGAISFTGADQVTGYDNLVFATGTSAGTGVVTGTIPSVVSGDFALAFSAAGNAMVLNTGTTGFYTNLNTGQTAGQDAAAYSTSSGNQTINWNQASSAPWSWIGVEVLAASGGGTPANVTGVGAAVTVAGGTGSIQAGANVTGVGAAVTMAGGAGTVKAGANVAGVGAAVTVAGGTGVVKTGANIIGVGARVTVAGGIGVAAGGGGSSPKVVALYGGTATRVANTLGGTATVVNTLGGTATVKANTLGGTASVVNTLGFESFLEDTMQEQDIVLVEYNDNTITFQITDSGVAKNITGMTINAYFKRARGDLDSAGTTKTYSSAGGSPAITVVTASTGSCSLSIPIADITSASVWSFWRVDVVTTTPQTNAAIFGTVTITPL